MRILALDAALGSAVAALVEDGALVADIGGADARSLAEMVADLPLDGLSAVAVTVGPGRFTGLRAAIALAQGISLARDVPLVAVTVAEALGEALPSRGNRALWVAIDSGRDRLFLDRGHGAQAFLPNDLPRPEGPVMVAGNAATVAAAMLAARGADVMLTDVKRPRGRDIGRAAMRRLRGEFPALAAVPLYVDPPAARLP